MRPSAWYALLGGLALGLVAWILRVEREPSAAPRRSSGAERGQEARSDSRELVAPARPTERAPDALPAAEAPERAPRSAPEPTPQALAAWLRELQPERFGALGEAEILALEELDLHGLTLDAADLALIARLPNLQRLGLRGTGLDDPGLAQLRGLPLESLDLRATSVTGAGFASLPNVTLRALHLTDTAVSGEDLAYLPAMPRLETLKLNGLRCTDAHLAALAIYPSLSHLELDRTAVSDAGLEALLAQHPRLTRVEARGSALTADGVAALRARYPRCEIVYETTDHGRPAR